jgi:magnesium-protoporphyrin IX monomethyl ester (oxidative) cyclase
MNAIQRPPIRGQNETTQMATTDTVLSPRFYTTDFAAMDAMDVNPIRAQWDALMDLSLIHI